MNQTDNMKNVSNSKENNLQADVVIVGTGVGGCFSALNLSEDLSIIMITKSDLESSDSFLAQGGICVLHDDDDYDSYFEDTMRAGHYENRKESVDIMIRGSQDVIHEDIITDKLRLTHVLLNICSNAVKFTPVGGMINIRVSEKPCRRDGYITVVFSI